MGEKIAIESLSMDLYRVAVGLHRGSNKMAKKFSDEAISRCMEIKKTDVKPYFVAVLGKIEDSLSNQPKERTAEDVLMYSILCKNYARKFLS